MRRAINLLARREHSRQELAAKLGGGAGWEELLDRLEQLGYLSDRRFAEVFVRSRMVRWGRNRLALELQRRGVAAEIVQESLQQILEVDEETRALAVLCKKQRVPVASHSKEEGRCRRFLATRGFTQATIQHALANHTQALLDQNGDTNAC